MPTVLLRTGTTLDNDDGLVIQPAVLLLHRLVPAIYLDATRTHWCNQGCTIQLSSQPCGQLWNPSRLHTPVRPRAARERHTVLRTASRLNNG